MSSTYLVLCQKFRRECGIAGSGPSAVTNQTGMMQKICDWIADAEENIKSKWQDWDFLLKEFTHTTTAGTKDISRPSDFGMWDMNSFYLNYTSDSYKKLTEYDYKRWRNNDRLGTQTNQEPDFIIRKPNGDLILHGPPDDAYSLTADYYGIGLSTGSGNRFSANSDVSYIPTKFDRLILMEAKMMWAIHEEAMNEYKAAQIEYDKLMNQMESQYLPSMESRTKADNEGMVVTPE